MLTPPALSRVGSHSAPANMKGEFKQLKRPFGSIRTSPFPYGGVALHNLLLDRFTTGRGGPAAGGGAQTGNPGISGHPLLPRVSKGRPGGNGARNRSRSRRACGRLDVAQSGSGARPFRTNAAGADHVGTRDRVGAAGRQARDGRDLRGRGGGVRSAFRELGSGEGARSGGTGTGKEPRCGVRRRVCAGAIRRPSESQRLAADLEKRFPEDTPVQFEYLPTLQRSFRTRSSGAVGRGRATATGASLRLRACRARRSLPNSEASIPRMYAARRTLQQDVARRPRRNFKKSSITAASSWPIR